MRFIGLVGIIILIGVAYLMSNDKKNINFKATGIMLGLQFLITFLMIGTNTGLSVVAKVAGGFNAIIGFGMAGVDFVIGDWVPEGASPFFVNALLIIVFTASLLSVLTHLRVLPLTIKYLGGVISKITGLPKVESFNAVNSIFFGQSEAILAIKNQLAGLNDNRLFIVSTSAMASVSASIIGAYMIMLPPKYVLVALFLNMFSALIMSSIVAPVKKEDVDDVDLELKDMIHTENIFDAIGQGALDGGKMALIVGAMLIAYLGLLAMINSIMANIIGVDLTTIMAYLFAPVSFMMGVPANEMLEVGGIMGTKIVANEFVAISQLQPLLASLSDRAIGIVSTFLISFGAFGSIGIISGSVQAINGAKAKVVTSFGLKMLLVATMSSALSATIVGLFL